MGFVEGRIKEEKVFGDLVFPKTLLPVDENEANVQNLAEIISREHESLSVILQRHGAVLFRGFNVETAQEFDCVVEAFGWQNIGVVNATTRVKITDRVYTANEAPLGQLINFHHEMALVKTCASKIFFFCGEPAPEGGETSIVRSDVVVDQMEERLPELMTKISHLGILHKNKTVSDNEINSKTKVRNKTWKWMLKTDDEVEAEKRAKQLTICSSINFNSDGSAEFVYGPMNPIRESNGKKAWFLPILGYSDTITDVNNSFGDGSLFPMEALRTYREILEDNCVDLKWQKGDILLVDNLSVQHARRPGKPPRVILVAVCK